MIIKKFQGKTEEEAVALARRELGDALVIMNVRSVKKKGLFSIFKSQIIEVTVALEEDVQGQNAAVQKQKETAATGQEADFRSAVAAVSEIAREHFDETKTGSGNSGRTDDITDGRAGREDIGMKTETAKKVSQKSAAYTSFAAEKGIEQKLDDLQNLLEKNIRSGRDDAMQMEKKEEDVQENSNIAFFKLLYSVMLDNEVDERVANQLIDELDRSMKPNMPIDYMLSNVYQKMILKFGQPSMITPAEKGPKFVFFIGPTGVGKTTTIAKIASKLCVEEKKKVALLTADTYRIAAAEQLRTYASILEVPFRVIYTPSEITSSRKDFQEYDYVLVDTAGHSHYNRQQRDNMIEFVGALDYSVEKEVYLVVSATTKYSDLLSIADTYQAITDFKLIFTKLDETKTLGNLLNVKLHTGAQMSYITCGQNVPDDIALFDAQDTVKKLLGGGGF